MVNMILGRKLGMTQVWSEDDNVVPVTVIQAGPCMISQIKTQESDGYCAVQLGYGDVRKWKQSGEYRVNKPMAGHFAKGGVEPSKFLRECRVDDPGQYSLGDKVTVGDFADVKKVNVTGTSKGKGFAGVMKRHNFRGGPGGHGAHFHRAPGSIGQCATPSRVYKGHRLPGHMGDERVTVRNLEVVSIDEDQNLIMVKGAVPGGKGAFLIIRKA